MTELGNGLQFGQHFEEAVSVKEAELATVRRFGSDEEAILGVQGNLAGTYRALGRVESALLLERDVYIGYLKLNGIEDESTVLAANNYAVSLNLLKRFGEAKAFLCKMIPVARRSLDEGHITTLRIRLNYATALYKADGATLDDLRESVTTLEDTALIARRVLGAAHPLVGGIARDLQAARAVLRARETPQEGA